MEKLVINNNLLDRRTQNMDGRHWHSKETHDKSDAKL